MNGNYFEEVRRRVKFLMVARFMYCTWAVIISGYDPATENR
jgi:hypothetical protein